MIPPEEGSLVTEGLGLGLGLDSVDSDSEFPSGMEEWEHKLF